MLLYFWLCCNCSYPVFSISFQTFVSICCTTTKILKTCLLFFVTFCWKWSFRSTSINMLSSTILLKYDQYRYLKRYNMDTFNDFDKFSKSADMLAAVVWVTCVNTCILIGHENNAHSRLGIHETNKQYLTQRVIFYCNVMQKSPFLIAQIQFCGMLFNSWFNYEI